MKISVIITAYNRKKFIKKAIESVLAQNYDYHSIELIIITNYQFDTNMYKNEIDIKFIKMDGTIGQFLSAGLEAAKNEIVAFLDDDDLWTKEKIVRLVEVFRDRNVVFFHNLYSYIDSHGNEIKYTRRIEKDNLHTFKIPLVFNSIRNQKKIKLAIEMRGDFNLSCIAVRRDFAIVYIDLLRKIEGSTDGFFFWIAIFSGGGLFIDNLPLTNYRIHDLNSSGSSNFQGKVIELKKQILTFELLIQLIGSLQQSESFKTLVQRWLNLYKYEYTLVASVFDEKDRIFVITILAKLIKNSLSIYNTLKYRTFAFAFLAVFSPKISKYIYNLF